MTKVVRAENLGQNSLEKITQTALDLKRTTSPTKTKVKQSPERKIC